MALKVPDVGEVAMLGALTADAAGWLVGLYTNDHEPQDDDQAGAYVEATFDGYEGQAPVFAAPQSQGGVATSSAAELTFQCETDGDPEEIWGYYVTRGGVLLFAEKLGDAVPFAIIELAGDRVRITPKLTFTTA